MRARTLATGALLLFGTGGGCVCQGQGIFVRQDAAWLRREPFGAAEPVGQSRIAPCGVWDGRVERAPDGSGSALRCRRWRLAATARERLVDVGMIEALAVAPEDVSAAEGEFTVLWKNAIDGDHWRRAYAERPVVWTGTASERDGTLFVELGYPIQVLVRPGTSVPVVVGQVLEPARR